MSKNGANNITLPSAQPADNHEGLPRIEGLFVRNYRVLRNVHIEPITPLTAFVGPNGSGKSTIFDIFSFLSRCITGALRDAWDSRGGLRELRSRGADGPVSITLVYREQSGGPKMLYYLTLNEDRQGNPQVVEEKIKQARRKEFLLHVELGKGYVFREGITNIYDNADRTDIALASPDILAVGLLSQFGGYPRVGTLSRLLTDWHLSSATVDSIRLSSETSRPERRPQRLLPNGQNLAQVIQDMSDLAPERFAEMLKVLTRWVPMLEGLTTKQQGGRLLLELKDGPFKEPITGLFASEGTLKLIAHLALLYGPDDPPLLIGLEEPENYLHPRLLVELAEACRAAVVRSQIVVSTHSPFFVDSLRPEEVWVLNRNQVGYAEIKRAADIVGIASFMENGAQLGDLWMEGYFREPASLKG